MERDEDFYRVVDAISFTHFQSVNGLMVQTGVPKKKIEKVLNQLAEDIVFDEQGRVAYQNGERNAD